MTFLFVLTFHVKFNTCANITYKVQTIRWPVFWIDKLQYVKVQVSNCMAWTVRSHKLYHWRHQACKEYLTNGPQLIINFSSLVLHKKYYNLIYDRFLYVIITRDVTDSKSASESDGIRHFSPNPRYVGYLKSNGNGFKFLFRFNCTIIFCK